MVFIFSSAQSYYLCPDPPLAQCISTVSVVARCAVAFSDRRGRPALLRPPAGSAVTLLDGELGRLSCGRRSPRRRAQESSSAPGARSSSAGASFAGSTVDVHPMSPRPPRNVSSFFCLWFLYFFLLQLNHIIFNPGRNFAPPSPPIPRPSTSPQEPPLPSSRNATTRLASSSRPIPRRWGSPNPPSQDDALRRLPRGSLQCRRGEYISCFIFYHVQYFLTPRPANCLKELVAQSGLLQTADELMSDYVRREEELVKVPRAEVKAMTVVYLAWPRSTRGPSSSRPRAFVGTRGRVGRVEPPRHG